MKYAQLVKAIDSTGHQLLGRVATAVNHSLVIRNWLVGAYIVEFEQNGEDRARYGDRLLPRLANDLEKRAVAGLGLSMLKSARQFYFLYPQIGQTVSGLLRQKVITNPIGQSLIGLLRCGAARKAIGQSSIAQSRQQQPSEVTVPNNSIVISTSVRSEFSQDPPTSISTSLGGKSADTITPLSANAVLHFSWTQLIELIRIDDPLKRAFYENECLKGNWSVRQLQRQIGSLLYERTGLSTNKAAVLKRARSQEPQETIEDLIRDPYILEFSGLAELPQYTESDLETALLDHLQQFLLELGAGFLFEARQRRITVGNEHDYIDLVFYHRHLRCHVLLELKTRPFRHGDAGQMNFYLNWWKRNVTTNDEQPPVGILLCSDKDRTKVEFATAGMDNRLFVSRYLTSLPSAEQLQRFVETDRARVEALMEQQARPHDEPRAVKCKRKNAKSAKLPVRRR